jgi:hypothetical protein
VQTQHMRLGFWRCDQCPNSDRKPNDFNRKDLFIQHVRRMHPLSIHDDPAPINGGVKRERTATNPDEDKQLDEIAGRCYQTLRSPPERSGCLFCDAAFEGLGSWDERMEHVGEHMKAMKNGDVVEPSGWQVDRATEEWLVREGVLVKREGGLRLS